VPLAYVYEIEADEPLVVSIPAAVALRILPVVVTIAPVGVAAVKDGWFRVQAFRAFAFI